MPGQLITPSPRRANRSNAITECLPCPWDTSYKTFCVDGSRRIHSFCDRHLRRKHQPKRVDKLFGAILVGRQGALSAHILKGHPVKIPTVAALRSSTILAAVLLSFSLFNWPMRIPWLSLHHALQEKRVFVLDAGRKVAGQIVRTIRRLLTRSQKGGGVWTFA